MPTEPSWLSVVVNLAAGFLLLFKGADWMVDGSSRVARRMGVSVLVIGLTIVAFGTSAPEIVVSGLAALEGDADLSIGNVLGSNVANIGLVLGACALVLPKVLEARFQVRELFWLFASLGLLWWTLSDLALSRAEAGILLGAFVTYNVTVLAGPREEVDPSDQEGALGGSLFRAFVGIAAIGFGAKLVVDGAEGGAVRIGLPQSVIGLTIVAIGTSLPELAAGLGAAFKGEKDISLGNVIGSNVFNVLAVMGIVGVIQPLEPERFSEEGAANLERAFRWALSEDFWVVLGFSLLAVLLPLLGRQSLGRLKGAILLLAYVGYSAWLYASRGLG
ncbi:MAG: calcium/sodium antiporter [Planctomycetota bacterium]